MMKSCNTNSWNSGSLLHSAVIHHLGCPGILWIFPPVHLSLSIRQTNLKEYADRVTLQGCPSHRNNHLVSISRSYRISLFRLGDSNKVDWIRWISELFVRKKYQFGQIFPVSSFYPLTLLHKVQCIVCNGSSICRVGTQDMKLPWFARKKFPTSLTRPCSPCVLRRSLEQPLGLRGGKNLSKDWAASYGCGYKDWCCPQIFWVPIIGTKNKLISIGPISLDISPGSTLISMQDRRSTKLISRLN